MIWGFVVTGIMIFGVAWIAFDVLSQLLFIHFYKEMKIGHKGEGEETYKREHGVDD